MRNERSGAHRPAYENYATTGFAVQEVPAAAGQSNSRKSVNGFPSGIAKNKKIGRFAVSVKR